MESGPLAASRRIAAHVHGTIRRPRARAANAKDFLEFLETFRPGATAHLRAALPRQVMEAVEGSARTDWNSLELDGPYVTEIVRWLGADRARAAWRQFTCQRFVFTPAMRSLVDGAMRLFGLSVGSFVRIFPLGFKQGFRDFGDLRLELGANAATVVIADLAPEVVRYDAYTVLFHGVYLGVYDVARAEPQLEFLPELSARRITARFRW